MAVDNILDECDGDRSRVLKRLRFFGPLDPAQRRDRQFLLELLDEFGDELPLNSWLHHAIESLPEVTP